jgi:hypothetical protein
MAEPNNPAPRTGERKPHLIGSKTNYIFDELRPIDFDEEQKANSDRPCREFLVISTAPCNVEDLHGEEVLLDRADRPGAGDRNDPPPNTTFLRKIARTLKDGGENPEIVIAIHGYATSYQQAIDWYNDICVYRYNDIFLRNQNDIFVGYRWPSENPFNIQLKRINDTFSALPSLLLALLVPAFLIGLVIAILSFHILLQYWFFVGAFAFLLVGIPLAFVLQRYIAYFRDAFRANYFATPDLVSFVCELDEALYTTFSDHPESGDQSKASFSPKVKLSILAHSMGCSIATNALRSLADAFSNQSQDIGKTLVLNRLILVAPDIPVESVVPRRSNFLTSALQRVQETHVFTNEADLPLRLASTAANYISFPARKRISGSRLGNLTVKHFNGKRDRKGSPPVYGILNLHPMSQPAEHLEIRLSSRAHLNLNEDSFAPWKAQRDEDVTNLINYYDCTDMIDVFPDPCGCGCVCRGVVSRALRKPALSTLDYICQMICGDEKTHTGYFDAPTSKKLIYVLAFTGFADLIRRTKMTGADLDQLAREKQVQILLSPGSLQTLACMTHEVPSRDSEESNSVDNDTPRIKGVDSVGLEEAAIVSDSRNIKIRFYHLSNREVHLYSLMQPYLKITASTWATEEWNGKTYLVLDGKRKDAFAITDDLNLFVELNPNSY